MLLGLGFALPDFVLPAGFARVRGFGGAGAATASSIDHRHPHADHQFPRVASGVALLFPIDTVLQGLDAKPK